MDQDNLPSDTKHANFEELMYNIDSNKLLEAMRSKIDSMEVNQIWTLVNPPERIKSMKFKWAFTRKTGINGNV